MTENPQSPSPLCDALRDFVPFVQFKKHEKHAWRNVNFRNTLPWVFFTFFKLYKWYQIAQRTNYVLRPNTDKNGVNILQIRLDFAQCSYSDPIAPGLHYPSKVNYELQSLTKLQRIICIIFA